MAAPIKGKFVKGQSGNPSGRPKIWVALQDIARVHTEQAIEVLVAALSDESGSVRVNAANSLLDRGWGKPLPALPTATNAGTPYLEVRFVWPSEPQAPTVDARQTNGQGTFALSFDAPEEPE